MESKKGLGLGLLDLAFPFFLPIKGIVWLAEEVQRSAELEQTDTSKIRQKLLELQIRLEINEISEEEYDVGEAILLEKLEEIRIYEEEKKRNKDGQ
jgi:hypothetical protein